MTIPSAEALSIRLRPLCSRDNHVMKYESAGSKENTGSHASYHCGFGGCSVRYDTTDGYYMLIGMPDRAGTVDEPGVNAIRCPRHHQWLYRKENIGAEPGFGWSCGVEGCEYSHRAPTKAGRGGSESRCLEVFKHRDAVKQKYATLKLYPLLLDLRAAFMCRATCGAAR